MHELFEHTADLGLRARAADLDSLFADMAKCLFTVIVDDIGTVLPTENVRIEVTGTNREFLLFDWLRELFRRFDAELQLFSRFEVKVRDDGLSANAWGETLDPTRHVLSHEVKAITYHELKVERDSEGWLAEAIVDI